MTLAVNRTCKNEAGEKMEECSSIDCTAFGKTAEVAGQYLKKRQPLLIVAPGEEVPQWLTKFPGLVESPHGLDAIPVGHGLPSDPPEWFARVNSTNYQVWYSTNLFTPFILGHEKQKGQIFVTSGCGGL